MKKIRFVYCFEVVWENDAYVRVFFVVVVVVFLKFGYQTLLIILHVFFYYFFVHNFGTQNLRMWMSKVWAICWYTKNPELRYGRGGHKVIWSSTFKILYSKIGRSSRIPGSFVAFKKSRFSLEKCKLFPN